MENWKIGLLGAVVCLVNAVFLIASTGDLTGFTSLITMGSLFFLFTGIGDSE